LGQTSTGDAAVCCRDDDRTRTAMSAFAAADRACSPCGPCGQRAVNRACKGVASNGRTEVATSSAVSGGCGDYRASASLGAATARHGAGAVGRPSGHLAVGGASECAAGLGAAHTSASNAAVLGSIQD